MVGGSFFLLDPGLRRDLIAQLLVAVLACDAIHHREDFGFPDDFRLSQVHLVLDLACGPGGWAIDVARAYPNIDVMGVDISQG